MDPRVADIMARIATLPSKEREEAARAACGADEALFQAVLNIIIQSSDDNSVTVAVPPTPSSQNHESPPDMAERSEPGPGIRKVGHFRIEATQPLGRGGFGEVWEGLRDEGGFRQRVAIKILARSITDSKVVRRFELERQVLASLDHPDIARLIDGGTLEDDRPWLAMEYVDGVSITQFCDRERLTVEARIRLFQRVAMAVQHAHENLVIHRDIKPDNVLVTNDGGPKLLDFGIAKIVNPELGGVATAVTQAGEGVLTPDYAAPEQFTGEGIGVRSDVYSLGILLYELLTSRIPFANEERKYREIRSAKLEQDPPAPSLAVSTVSKDPASHRTVCENRDTNVGRLRKRLLGDIDVILLKALRREPSRRYASPRELVQDLQRHLDGLPVEARPDSIAYRTTRFVARHRTGVAFAASLVIVIALGAIAVAATASSRAEKMRAEVAEARFEIESTKRAAAEQVREALENIQIETSTIAKRDVVDALKLANRMDLAKPVLEARITQLKSAIEADPENISVKALYIQAMLDLAQIHYSDRNPSLGDQTAGEQIRTNIRSFIKEARSSHPNDPTLLALDAQFEIEGIDEQPVDLRMSKLENARSQILQAEEGMGKNLDERRMLARIETEIGDLLQDQGDDEAAIDRYTQALGIYEQLRIEDPSDPKRTRDLAVATRRIGSAHAGLKRYEEARSHLERSLKLRDELAESEGRLDASRTRRDLGLGHKALAAVLRSMGSTQLARYHYEQYLQMTFEVAFLDPLDARGGVNDVLSAITTTTLLPRLDGDYSGFRRWNHDFREQIVTPRLRTIPDVNTRWMAIRCDRNLAAIELNDAQAAEMEPDQFDRSADEIRQMAIDRLTDTIEISGYVLDQDMKNAELIAEIGLCQGYLSSGLTLAGKSAAAAEAITNAVQLHELASEIDSGNYMVKRLGRFLDSQQTEDREES